MTPKENSGHRQLPVLRAIRLLTIATAFLYLWMGTIGALFFLDAKHKREDIASLSRDTAKSICALRARELDRIAQSEQFLRENPKGIPGISASLVRRSINSSQGVVKALRFVNCPP